MSGPPPLPSVSVRDLEALSDAYAYLLATDSRTSAINWILGDVGMGGPETIPFGYISILSERVTWYTAGGGTGGLATSVQGYDDWEIPVVLTVVYEPFRGYVPPVPAAPPATSPFNPSNNVGFSPPYLEQPGWRAGLEMVQKVKATLRTNHNVGGAATDTRIVESRYILQVIKDQPYRAARITIQTQQRRQRGL